MVITVCEDIVSMSQYLCLAECSILQWHSPFAICCVVCLILVVTIGEQKLHITSETNGL